MKTIEFKEEDLKNLNFIGQQLFQDENDPTSLTYNRKINRPKIHWFKIIGFCLLLIIICVAFGCWLNKNGLLIASAVNLAILFMFLKRIAICMVRIYQRFAPESIRRKCRFEPSCSEYMILAIEKYGLWKGIAKGINRLKRCNINDGGFDYP